MTATAFRSLEEARGKFGPCALTIGNFDGVHLGHQALMREMVGYANSKRLIPAVLTFHPHPAAIVAPERVPEMICTLEERLDLLSAAGARRMLVLPFTAEIARLQPEEFISQILADALETRTVFVGQNFRFGYQQGGTPESLMALGREHGFISEFLKPVTWRRETVSSSLIRNYLSAGKVSRAARLLGRCFSIAGEIVPGHGVGTKQTVPTLNVRPASGQLTPRGVYITETFSLHDDRHWPSITNVGIRPTFGGDELTIESFLLSSLEGEPPRGIQVQFRRFVREERQFASPADLKGQIMRDVSRAQDYWRRVARLAQAAASIY